MARDLFQEAGIAPAADDTGRDLFAEAGIQFEPVKKERSKRTAADIAKDVGIVALKGAVALPESVVGLADIPTGGRVGKFLDDYLGYRPAEAKKIAGEWFSDAQKEANAEVDQAEGFVDTARAAIQNPSTIAAAVGESLPQMVGGAGVARGILKAAPKVAPWAAAALGEGAMGAGSSAAQTRAESEDGLLTPKQSIAALASGAGTAVLGAAGGKAAQRMGLADVDTMLAAGKTVKSPAGFAKAVVGSGISEGAFEELPQSVQEQMWQNYAQDKPLTEGVDKAAAMGLLSGAAMGGAGGGYNAAASSFGGQDGQDQAQGAGAGQAPEDQAPPAAGAAGTVQPTSGVPAQGRPAASAQTAGVADTQEAERALREPVKLTALDRANELDAELTRIDQRAAELTPGNGYGPAFDAERADLQQQAAAARAERDQIASTFPPAIKGVPAQFSTEAGVKLDGEYALIDADNLVTSHDENLRANPMFPAELQPRDRSRQASEMQVSGIVQKLDPARLGLSADAATGAPIVGADGLVESGNARSIALKRVYQANGQKAADYKAWLKSSAAQFGITPESVDGMQKPVLVRVRNTPVNRAEFARQANQSTVQRMSPSEQATSDAQRLASLEGLNATEEGDFSTSYDFIRQFMAGLPVTEQADMLESDGRLSAAGYRRIQSAVLAKAYGNSPTLRRLTESMDSNVVNVGKALTRVAPVIAAARERIQAGALHDADIAPDLVAAVEGLSSVKDKGWTVEQELGQGDLTGPKYSPEAAELLQFLADNIRSPRRIAEFLQRYYEAMEAAGDPNQGSLLGDDPAPTRADLLKNARGTTDGQPDDQGTVEPAGQDRQEPQDAQGDQSGAQGDGQQTQADATAGQPGAAEGQAQDQREAGSGESLEPAAKAPPAEPVPEPVKKAAPRTADRDFWSYAKEQGYVPKDVSVGSELHTRLKVEFEALKAGKARLKAMTGKKLGEGWAEFTKAAGALGVPRADMPQIKVEHRGALTQFLAARGITHQAEADLDAMTLRPTQVEFSADKVKAAQDFEGGERSILISADSYVLDGHHQWLAKLAQGLPIRAIRFDAPMADLLPVVREFPSAEAAEGAAPAMEQEEAADDAPDATADDAEAGPVPMLSRSSDPIGGGPLGALEAISKTDDLFSLPKSDATTVEDIAADHDPEIKVRKTSLPGNETMYTLTMADGTRAFITVRASGPNSVYGAETDGDNNTTWATGRPGENPEAVPDGTEDVWIDVSNLRPGQNGARVYNIAATLAHNTGRIFIGDPAGLSDEAMRRRAENMLSSALKFGTTKHLAPHPRQAEGATGIGVPALKWVYGDDIGNIERLIEVNVKALDSAYPESAQITYDPATGLFGVGEGEGVPASGLRSALSGKLAADRRGNGSRPAFAGAGWRTLARGAVFRALLRERGAQGDGAGRAAAGQGTLDQLVRQRAQLASTAEDQRVFYSRGLNTAGDLPGRITFDDLQALADRLTEGMPNMPAVHVLADPSKAPRALREYIIRQDAWYDVEGAMHDGELYLFASGLASAERAEHVLLEHEAAHYGLRAVLGKSLNTAMRLVYLQNASVRKAVTELQKRGKLSDILATEEVIVDIPSAELAKLKGWPKVVGMVRDFMVLRGYDAIAQRLTDWIDGKLTQQQRADLFVADLVRAARDHVKGKRPALASVALGTMLSRDNLSDDIDRQETWLQREAQARGFKDIEDLLERDYPAFEKLAELWRKKNPASSLLSRAAPSGGAMAKTVADRAEAIIQKPVASAAPLDRMAKLATKVTGIERLTGSVYDKAGDLLARLTPEKVKAGIVSDYGVPDAVIDQRVMLQGRQRVQLRKVGTLIEKLATLTREESRVAYEWMNMDGADPRAYLSKMQGLPEESVKVLQEVQKLIDDLSQEAVRLGQLDAESFKRNRFAYLRRSYAKHILEQTAGQKAKRARVISILGDQYKGRGLVQSETMAKMQAAAPDWWGRKLASGKADTALKGAKFIRLEKRALPGKASKALPGMAPADPGKVQAVAYWPADQKITGEFAGWTQADTWEVRDVKGGNVVLWRDFTKVERETMGEVDEARFAIAKTMHGMIHDVETGRYLEWLARNYAKAEGQEIPGTVVEASERMRDTFAPSEWVKVPDTKIAGTSVLKYGALAGKYLPGPIWNDLRQIVAGGQFRPFGETYATILRYWKTAKTALSPSVHMNNVMSNMVMADWQDVRAAHVGKALRIVLAASGSKGGIADAEAATEILNRYKDSGGELGTWATQEVARDQLDPLLAELETELAATADQAMDAQAGIYMALQHALGARFPAAWEALKAGKTGKAAAKAGGALIDLYQAEDDVFRLAAWLKAKEGGADDLAAGKVARRSFLDYHINAPWVQAMRASAWPFISFTYRAVPLLAEIAGKKPHKLFKLMALAGGLNALGVLMGGDGDDDERKLLPEEKAGAVWGMVPKLIRMPWNDAHGSPVYLDIRRWVPVGDVFDVGQGQAAVPMLPGLMPGGPLVLAGEVVLNKSAFTGKPLTLETDTAAEKTGKMVDYLTKAFAPNIPLPNPIGYGVEAVTGVKDAGQTYSWTNISGSMSGRTDAFGRELSPAQAMASSVGVKLGSYPKDVLEKNLRSKAEAEKSEIDKNISQLKRQFNTGRLSRDEYDRLHAAQMAKKRKINDELNAKRANHSQTVP